VHGAQLTGVPMMGIKPCAQMLELFPTNYVLPYYYGALAVQGGVSHSYIYLSETDIILPGVTWAGKSYLERARARSINVCPSLALLINAVRELIRDWRKCCNALLQ